ncbi:MAG: PTS sugar transporter subunit IIC [Erysipelotrichaceae bacterium]|nr:PTS sugar transporter subunit IIC [Erysipelotrichaceae bacterium]
MSIGLALYVSLICTLLDWAGGYGCDLMQIASPIISGAIVGILLGDAKTGIIIGGTLHLVYMGVIGVGAAIPANKTTATTIAVAFCILSHLDQETAIALAVPASIMGQLSNIAAWVINAVWMHLGDKAAEDADFRKMTVYTWLGSLVFFVVKFIPIFLCIYYGAPFVEALNNNMPPLVSRWLNVAKGMLPALGFGMLFSMMYKPKYLPYFIIGFILSAVFGGSLLAIGALGVAAALLAYYSSTQKGVE